MSSFERQIKELLAEQKQTWQVARENYAALGKVQTRTFNYLGRELLVQFNPERIRSSAAKVDKTSLQARPCFFCHRPKEQKSVIYNEDFEVLVNPYPIFQEHLTIPLRHHERQQILPYFHTLLELAVVLPSFVLFYNGPKCGASAPDHMHFQAGNNLGFPLFKDWCGINKTQVWEEKNTRLYTSVEALPRMFFMVSKKKEEVLLHEKPRFIEKSIQNGYTKEVAEQIYNLILKFANYGFNKSHSVGYATVAYKMAFLKTYFFKYFETAILNNVIGNDNKTKIYLAEICNCLNIN